MPKPRTDEVALDGVGVVVANDLAQRVDLRAHQRLSAQPQDTPADNSWKTHVEAVVADGQALEVISDLDRRGQLAHVVVGRELEPACGKSASMN